MAGVYRRYGADGPWGDPRRAHGVAMEGYFWRFTLPGTGRVVVALCGVTRSRGGSWATLALAGHPSGFLRHADARPARDDERALGVDVGGDAFVARPDRLRVLLAPDARLDVALEDVRGWPRWRPFGGVGAGHAVPGLGQYWHPHVLGGRARGRAVLGEEEISLDGARVYAEKNWGRGGFPERWWWGQAQGFADPDVCVAFAGGHLSVGPARLQVSALVVRLGAEVIRLGDPLLSPPRTEIGDERWNLRARGPRWSVEVEGSAPLGAAHVLPVPLPAEGHSVPGALEHLGGHLRLVVRRRGRVRFAGESALAGLEHGGTPGVEAEIRRRQEETA